MKIVVACRCGQHFATDRRHLGKTVRCPACQEALEIVEAAQPTPPPPPRPAPAQGALGIRVRCACGWAFQTPQAYEGRQVHCPACHSPVIVPGSDPLALGGAIATPLESANAWLSPVQPTNELADRLAQRLAYIAGGSVALLALAIVVSASINAMVRPANEAVVADASPAPPRAPARSSQSSLPPPPPHEPASVPLPPRPDAAADESASSPPASSPPVEVPAPPGLTNDPAAKIATAPVAVASVNPPTPKPPAKLPSARQSAPVDLTMSRLPEATHTWLEQSEGKLLGIRRVGTITNPGAHFSWMTGLLPYLDYKPIYDKIDFSKPATSPGNLTAGTAIINEFLNPHDDRQRWKGYPFEGLGMSHFAGMSGVEDARNVVAAKLPRSDPRAGVFGYDEVARAKDITDGTSQTIMIVGTGAMANPWILGGGGTIRGAREPLFDGVTGLGMKGLSSGGTMAVMADGSVRQMNANIDPRVFKAMSTIHGSESVDLDQAAAMAGGGWKAMGSGTARTGALRTNMGRFHDK